MKRSRLFLLAAALSASAPGCADGVCDSCTPARAPGEQRQIGDTRVFARIGEPGMPEGIAVGGGLVYVGTHTSVLGNAGGPPSKIFKFDVDDGTPLGEITIEGQDTSVTHGILGMKFGPDGALYVVDQNPGRIVRIDLSSGAQATYATIPDLAPCTPLGPTTGCAPGLFALQPTWANDVAFAADGSLYVTDLQAATIFRVPPRGGAVAIWYQDPRFDSYFGLNGVAVDPAGTKLYVAMTFSPDAASFARGIIYTLPIQATSPEAADLAVFHEFEQPVAGPDGLAFGASGKVYVALAGANQLAILNPDGTLDAIFPPDPVTNSMLEIPYDAPANVAFRGDGSALVTNHPFFTGDPNHWAVLDVWVDDTAAP